MVTIDARIMENIMVMMVREKIPSKASFCRILIRTFQSNSTGIVMTEDLFSMMFINLRNRKKERVGKSKKVFY